MRIRDCINADIGDEAIRILHKKIGKRKGLEEIENQIRDEAEEAAKESFGGELDRVARVHIERYVQKRMGYMKHAFRKLNNPKTDVSKKRGNFIGDTETKNAKEFGRAKGFERLAKTEKREIFKKWEVGSDGCEDCEANGDEGPIPIDEDFQSGDYAPQAHPNCDCELVYIDTDGNEIE